MHRMAIFHSFKKEGNFNAYQLYSKDFLFYGPCELCPRAFPLFGRKKSSLVTFVESCYMGSNFKFTVRAALKRNNISEDL